MRQLYILLHKLIFQCIVPKLKNNKASAKVPYRILRMYCIDRAGVPESYGACTFHPLFIILLK